MVNRFFAEFVSQSTSPEQRMVKVSLLSLYLNQPVQSKEWLKFLCWVCTWINQSRAKNG